MQSLDWNDLQILLEVSRAGSLAGAGQRMGIDQSTVSRRLTRLEADLGATLFMRSRKGLVPTNAGQIAVRRAAGIERQIDIMSENVVESDKALSGVIEVFGNPWLLSHLTATSAKVLLTEHPKLLLRANGTGRVHPDNTDPAIGFFLAAKPQAPWFEIKLGDIPYGVYQSAVSTGPPPATWVAFHEPGVSRADYLPKLNRLRDLSEPIIFTASETGILVKAVEAGVGKGLLPLCLGVSNTSLARVGDDVISMEATLHLHPDTVQLRRVQTVLRWVRSVFKDAFMADALN